MDKKQREARRRQEDIALQRGLMWVAGAIVLEALLVFVNRFYINYYTSEIEIALAVNRVLHFLRLAAPIAGVLALLWTSWQLKQGKKFGLLLVVSIALGAVSICSHVALKFQRPGVSMLFWLVIAWAVLALVYYIYQREFFLASSAAGMSVLALWFSRYGIAALPETILVLAAVAGVTAVAFLLKQKDGVLPFSNPVQFLPKKTNYAVLLITCLVSLAAILAGIILGEMAAYYLIFVMIACLFILFVYYTVKLM